MILSLFNGNFIGTGHIINTKEYNMDMGVCLLAIYKSTKHQGYHQLGI